MKFLHPYGVSYKQFTDPVEARGFTYTTKDDRCPSTPIIFDDNPYNENIKNARYVLDVGCGIGRNLQGVMENTNAVYYGFDPNPDMMKFFWNWQDTKYKDRVILVGSLDDIPSEMKFDLVLITFVFQHIGYMPLGSVMNVADIGKEVSRFTQPETVWEMYEHDGENDWIQRWFDDMKIDAKNITYKRNYTEFSELIDRGSNHHLILFKEGVAIQC